MFYLALGWSLLLAFITVYVINRSYAKGIRQSQETIIESLTDGVLGIDKKGKIVLYNSTIAKITGIPINKAIGQDVDTILKLYNKQQLIPFSIYGDANEHQTKNGLQIHNESGEIPFEITLSPIAFSAQDKGYLLTLHNLSQENQLEEMKVDFVSMAAHELRTPLTAIRGYASLLQMHYATKLEDQAKELLTRLIVSTNNLANLIDNLLSVSRIEQNSMIIDKKPVDLAIIIKDIFESFKSQAQTRHQQFTLTMPDNLPIVIADPFRIGQVFINLISNAINYTQENGTISVTAHEVNGAIEIAVQDNGEGIPADAVPRLFTKFFRVSGSLEQGSKGTGLGLYITKSIIELHKGKIWAESVLGKGSTFTVTIPIPTPEELAKHKEESNQAFLTVKNGQGIIVRKAN
jgi:two-component system phosphate regulon sensor histidine kinase PhoR